MARILCPPTCLGYWVRVRGREEVGIYFPVHIYFQGGRSTYIEHIFHVGCFKEFNFVFIFIILFSDTMLSSNKNLSGDKLI